MNPQFTIRTTHENDMRAYRELRLEALKNHPTAFGMDYETSAAQPESYWLERLQANDDRATFVAESGGQFVGMAGIFWESNVKEHHAGYIWGVYVRPAWRGAGVADSLIAACLAWAREHELRLVRLSVNATNGAAIRCYLRHGFSIYGVDPEVILWDGVYYDELLMVKRLVSSRST
ncbi:MAG TPA: GNAT family N-acetyltransferase [Roseiflexaceae bacterium]|nr:GNAT family N-acetyltransferase [Roseiflexaceae bacterium]